MLKNKNELDINIFNYNQIEKNNSKYIYLDLNRLK